MLLQPTNLFCVDQVQTVEDDIQGRIGCVGFLVKQTNGESYRDSNDNVILVVRY